MPKAGPVITLLVATVLPLAVLGSDLALVHARIYPAPDAAPIADGTVLIRDGRIVAVGPGSAVAIPKGTECIDVGKAVVTAGFWNSHVHLMSPPLLKARERTAQELSKELTRMLTQWGFTTVFDTASLLANTNVIRSRIASGEVPGPMVLTVGDPFYPKGGTPIYVKQFMKDNGFPDEEITDLPEAVARVRRQIGEEGADGIKLFAGAIVGGAVGVLPMPLDQARALAAAAHAAGKPVFAHPSNFAGLDVSIESGVDILAHPTSMSGPWPPEVVTRVREHRMALIPTLTLFKVEAAKFGEPEEDARKDMDAAVQQVGALSRAGGQILFGTDIGYTDAVDTTDEYRLLARALDWRQILASLTVAPAGRFGYAAKKGRVAAGMDADLAVLGGDPEKEVTAFAQVRRTFRAGVPIYSAAGSPAAAPCPN
jgi:imidazolonepropionase-like amidohydrolase